MNFHNIFINNNPQRQYEEDVLLLDETAESSRLVVHNDDFNTFEFVIECLMEICGHTPEQAEQCTMLIHYKGKCTVKTGDRDRLEPMHAKLLSRGLSAEII